MQQGSFYLVPVPIGNLEDISARGLAVLRNVDYILAEDTRNASLLLSQYGISADFISYHQFNEKSRIGRISSDLEKGLNIALISDAGMPCISDPGSLIVQELIEKEIRVISLPGANAALTALVASGLNTEHFLYYGFLANKGKERKEQLLYLAESSPTVILYEAPHRLLRTLADLCATGLGERKIAIGRELTKKYETYFYGTVALALEHYQQETPRGEFVLVLEGKQEFTTRQGLTEEELLNSLQQEIEQDLQELLDGGMRLKAASRYLAEKYAVPAKRVYETGLKSKD